MSENGNTQVKHLKIEKHNAWLNVILYKQSVATHSFMTSDGYDPPEQTEIPSNMDSLLKYTTVI